jgi:hypothetical protein
MQTFRFGGGATGTVMHPVVLAAMLVAILLVLVLPRRWVIAPLFLIAFFAPFGQELYLAGVHFFVLRTVVLAGCFRLLLAKLLSQKALFADGFNSIDKVFCLWALSRAAAFMLVYSEGGAVVNQVAFLLDALGGYFILRYIIQDEDDIVRVAKLLAVVTVVMGVCMLNERLRGVNVFGYAGSLNVLPQLRDGQIRAQGAFGHPILAGTFGATLVPLFFWLWKSGRARVAAIAGFAGSTAMVLAAASSTPVLAYGAGIGGLSLWPIRNYLRQVRWSIVLTLVGLAMVMKAPVWFVIAHLDVVSASSGWHRAQLVDTFVRHFADWWALGANNNELWGSETIDTSNQFIAEGVSGGLLALTLFIVMIHRGFSGLGTARRLAQGDRKREWFLWSLGAVLLAHVVAFWGVAYWDQTRLWWFASLTIISVATVCFQGVRVEARGIGRPELEPTRLT